MKNTTINIFMFAAGAAIGSLATWKFVKTKYERIAQEEIESVKETWERLNREESDSEEEELCEEDAEEDPSDVEDHAAVMTDYSALTRRYNRSSDDGVENSEEGGGDDEVPHINGPQLITPDEYGDGNFDHNLYCLTYYSDNVLADDWFVKYDIDETIGLESLDHFGDYTDEVVHVRNERLRGDYEIVRDYRTYREVVAANPLAHMHGN